jgi:hypothetical protein
MQTTLRAGIADTDVLLVVSLGMTHVLAFLTPDLFFRNQLQIATLQGRR